MSQGNVLASGSKVRGFKSGLGRWVFSGRKNPEHREGLQAGVPESESSGSLKNLKPEENRSLSKI